MSRGGRLACAAGTLIVGAGLSAAAMGAAILSVSQRDRAFRPREVEAVRGDVLRIVNDDGELVHHAYIKSDSFSFDSGEQAPGTGTDIPLTATGTFTVLCAIHPKMRLQVTVK